MPVPYDLIRHFEGKEPIIDRDKRSVKEQTAFLLQPRNMSGKYLGACLDSCRWGSMTTTVYEMSVQRMVSFIQNWMAQNHNHYYQLFHERHLEEIYTTLELPHINHEHCPRNEKHTETITDLKGRVRCAHEDKLKYKPSFVDNHPFFDKLSEIVMNDCWIREPDEEDDEYQQYQREKTITVANPCYAIIHDKELILPLQTVLQRLNVIHKTENKYFNSQECSEFPCDGWDLAAYTQKWYEQLPGQILPPFFEVRE